MLGNWYTRPIITPQSAPDETVYSNTESASSQLQSDTTTTSTVSQDNGQYCYCSGPEEGLMIACDNSQCKIEWFHKSCLQIKTTPKGKWYCPDCHVLPQFQRKKKSINIFT